ARRVLERSLAPQLTWAALDAEGGLLGVAGVDSREGRFSHLRWSLLRREFGWLRALPRWALEACSHLFAGPRARRWRVAVLAVSDGARGRGVGTALLGAVVDEARRAGAPSVHLEVVDANP